MEITEIIPILNIYCLFKDTSLQYILHFRNGSLLATTSKDKKLRVIDPRSTECLRKGDSHQGTKASKVGKYLYIFVHAI